MTLGRSSTAIIHPALSTVGLHNSDCGLAYEGEWITRSLLQFVPLNSLSLLYNDAILLSLQRQDSARVHETRSKRKRQVFMGATPDCSMITHFGSWGLCNYYCC